MRVLLDLDNPVVKQEFLAEQKQLREKIKRRWEKDLKYKEPSTDSLTMKEFLKLLGQ